MVRSGRLDMRLMVRSGRLDMRLMDTDKLTLTQTTPAHLLPG